MPDTARHAAIDSDRPGDRLVRAGAALFVLGLVGVLGVVVPFFLGRQAPPLAWLVLASVTPAGLALALLGLLRGARSRRRESH